jgi:hypothetical protein
VRALHRAIYLVMAAATCLVLCAGITGYRGVWLDAALGLVTIEGVVFVGNGRKCPLPAVAQRNGADKGYVFDTFPNGSPGIPSGSSARVNTSFQVHLRVDPAAFTHTYNAVQLATAPVLAVAGNSPTFLGHRLWEETRIALCKQSIDDRDGRGLRRRLARVAFGTGWLREGPLALFAEGVRLHQPLLPVLGDQDPLDGGTQAQVPPLAELRLHQGTVWRWNRAIYDPASGGHLRIEMRALPAGPTVTDMLANAAFLIGLSRWLAAQDQRWTYRLSFERAEHGFYRAAQHGLAAELTWPVGDSSRLRTLPAAELVPELLPAARQGLTGAGVAVEEADHLLGIIAARVAAGQTGAVWQRRMLATLEPRLGRQRALAAMLERYLEYAATDQPVHTWPANS